MGIRLETLLFLGISAIIFASFMVELRSSIVREKTFAKELEFTDTTFIEVDTNRMKGRAFSSYGMREEGILTLYHIRYHTTNLEMLRAQKGTYRGDNIYLDGNITVHQKEGFDYATEHAVYNKKREILNITSPFVAVMNQNVIHGESLRYDMRKKEAVGERINAVIYTDKR